MTIKLLFFGELDIHQRDFLTFLNEHGYEVTIINTSTWEYPSTISSNIKIVNFYQNSSIPLLFKGPLGLLRKQVLYFILQYNGSIRERVNRIVKDNQIDVIYGSWGSTNLPELRILKKIDIPLIYEFLTYPNYVLSRLEKIENNLNKSIIAKMQGRIFPSERMKNYMLLKFNLDKGLNLCFQESYSLSCFYKQRLAKLSKIDNEPHLVFLGTDAYNIEKQIKALTKRKIHIHLCTKDALSIYDQKYVHKFDKFAYEKLFNGEFATFLTQFDACLVTYNFEGASALARYQNGLPNRFSFALTAGIPLVLPNGYLNACQQVVEEHKIGFAYETFDDLASALLEKDAMGKFALNALRNRESFTIEKNFDKINTFIKAVIG